MNRSDVLTNSNRLAVIVGAGLLLLTLLVAALAPGAAHAQAPDGVVSAAQADLGERLGVDPAGIELLRSEAVTWNDGCLWAAEADELCTQALVNGFVVWLSGGDDAYRYHTNASGSVVRLAESMIPLSHLPVAAFDVRHGVTALTANRVLAELAAAGFDQIASHELAVFRDWIPGSFSPQYIVGDATLEIFDLVSSDEAVAATNNLSAFGGNGDLGEDQTLWRFGSLLIILLNAEQSWDIQDVVAGIVGEPLLSVPAGLPLAPPDQAALDMSVTAVIDALDRVGLGATISDVAVNRPFLPSNTLSTVLRADGESIEVFGLVDPEATDRAVRAAGADSSVSEGLVIWTRGSTLIVFAQGGDPIANASFNLAMPAVFGAPAFVGGTVSAPTVPSPPPLGGHPPDTKEPVPLPSTGGAGQDGHDGTPGWVWGVIVGVAFAAIASGGAYRLWLRGRAE
jgi:hypothetical protein